MRMKKCYVDKILVLEILLVDIHHETSLFRYWCNHWSVIDIVFVATNGVTLKSPGSIDWNTLMSIHSHISNQV